MKIYIVDDDEIFQFTTRKMLQYLGMKEGIESISNGQLAIEKIKNSLASDPDQLPDAILLDINMPVMDGWDFLNQYKVVRNNISKPIRIYMISSSVDDRDMARAEKDDSVTKYISKPVDEVMLKEMIGQETLI